MVWNSSDNKIIQSVIWIISIHLPCFWVIQFNNLEDKIKLLTKSGFCVDVKGHFGWIYSRTTYFKHWALRRSLVNDIFFLTLRFHSNKTILNYVSLTRKIILKANLIYSKFHCLVYSQYQLLLYGIQRSLLGKFILLNRSEIKKGVINGKPISYSLHNGRLVIPSVEEYVSGVYQCDVLTTLGIVTVAQYIHVRGMSWSSFGHRLHAVGTRT